MKRRDSSEFKSLVDLLEENTPAKKLSAGQKNKAHVRNLLQIKTKQRVGSGYLLTGDGYFITNNHVLPEETAEVYINKIPLSFSVQRTLMRSKPHDLVLAQIPLRANYLPLVAIANHCAEEGDSVRTYSFCGDKALRSHGTVVFVDSLRLFLDMFGLHNNLSNLSARTAENTQYSDCIIGFGWSGGPVVSENTGELVGITKAIRSLDSSFGFSDQYHVFSSSAVVRKMIDYFLDGQAK